MARITLPVGGLGVTDGGSVSGWLDGLKEGDDADIRRLWDRYFERLVGLARARLPGHTRRAADEEDVALSAFQSFCDRAGRGQFPRLGDRDDLWRVLATITARKVVASVRHQTRLKRGGGHVVGESVLMDGTSDDRAGLASFLSREPGPEDALRFAEDSQRLLEKLDNPTLKAVALRKLEGASSAELAAELGVTIRTIDRKLQLIQAIWENEVDE